MIRGAVVLLLVAALALTTVGCGGDVADPEASATVAWANDLCEAVTAWTDDLQAASSGVTSLSSLSVDALREAASGVESATDVFLADVRALGAPDTEAGSEARDALVGLADTIESEKREIEDALDGASGLTGIASAVSTIASSLTTMGQELEQTFERLGELGADDALERAFEDADACGAFRSR